MSNLPGHDRPDENKGPDIIGAVTTITLLALFTVCARIYVRLRMVHIFGIDDWMIIAAMILSVAGLGVVAAQVMYGAGRHVAYLDPDVNRFGLMLNFISQPIYLWAIPLVKLSVGFFLLRISPNKVYRRILQGTMVFLVAYTFMCFMTVLLQCKNVSVLWDTRVVTTCWSTTTTLGLSYANSTVNILTDLFFAAIPIPMLWNVQINPRTKASLICIMGLGIFASAAAIIKAAYLTNYGESGDFLWDSANLTIWVATELNTGIIAACLPCLKPMFKRVLNSSLHYSSNKKYGYKDDYNLRNYGPRNGPDFKYGRSGVTTRIESWTAKSAHGLDNDGENGMPSESSPPAYAITRTTTVMIDRSQTDTRAGSSWSKKSGLDLEHKVEDRI